MTDPTDLSLAARTALPDPLRVLLAEYPREAWQADPGFSELIRFWLDRHLMFRRLIDQMQTDAQAAIDGNISALDYQRRLARFGGMFVNELHMHHQIEDTHYFPVLEAQDSRIAQGFAILDTDHHQIDAGLHSFADTANAALRLAPESPGFTDAAANVLSGVDTLAPLLNRHLIDEEELVVPVLLKFTPPGLA
ncbi:MAG: dihydrodipicolinate reductase [Pseudooceanicola sp.]|nr:dihydrodipicolinate reductase [Pseudooceanicola sp.]